MWRKVFPQLKKVALKCWRCNSQVQKKFAYSENGCVPKYIASTSLSKHSKTSSRGNLSLICRKYVSNGNVFSHEGSMPKSEENYIFLCSCWVNTVFFEKHDSNFMETWLACYRKKNDSYLYVKPDLDFKKKYDLDIKKTRLGLWNKQ